LVEKRRTRTPRGASPAWSPFTHSPTLARPASHASNVSRGTTTSTGLSVGTTGRSERSRLRASRSATLLLTQEAHAPGSASPALSITVCANSSSWQTRVRPQGRDRQHRDCGGVTWHGKVDSVDRNVGDMPRHFAQKNALCARHISHAFNVSFAEELCASAAHNLAPRLPSTGRLYPCQVGQLFLLPLFVPAVGAPAPRHADEPQRN